MKKFLLPLFILILPFVLLSACLEKAIDPADPIQVQTPYAFATMPGAATGAAFMVMTNNGTEPDRLIAAKSALAEITEIHENIIDPDDGTMMMRKIPALELPAGQSVTLEPAGYHIMFIRMKEPLTIDKEFTLTLVFEKAGSKIIPVRVIAPGTQP